jgi:transketolase
MRTAFLKTLEELAGKDPRITLVVGDLGFTVIEPFREKYPKQFVNAGVAEQNMTGLAAGMAMAGRIVFTYSIANFPTLRCIEQIRNDCCYHNANVKVVSVGGGYAYGALGSTHHATEDLAMMRALPGMCVVAPGDPAEADAATRAVAERHGACYLRLGKAGEPSVHTGPIKFELGRAITLRDGGDITIISTGGMLHSCAAAALELEKAGIKARVLSMHTIKPLDIEAVMKAAKETRGIMTVEEHSATGGLGSAVAECLAQSGLHTRLKIAGLPDAFCREVGGQEYLRNRAGLSVESLVAIGTGLAGKS